MNDTSSIGRERHSSIPGYRPRSTPRDLSLLGRAPACNGPFIRRPLLARESGPHDDPHEAPTLRLLSTEMHALAFMHRHTDVFQVQPDEFHLTWIGASAHGTTTWAAGPAPHMAAWLAWDWVHLSSGVIMQVNPLGVRSNVELVHPDGRPLSNAESMVQLHCVIHRLNWHARVRAAV